MRQYLIASVATLLLAVPSQAQVTFVPDTAGLAALGTVTTQNLCCEAAQSHSYTFGDVTYVATSGPTDPLRIYPTGFAGVTQPTLINDYNGGIAIDFAGTYQLIGVFFGRFNPGSQLDTITVTTNLGSYDFQVTLNSLFNGAAPGFAGFSATGPEYITRLSFSGLSPNLAFNSNPGITGVQFGNPTPPGGVPEPASWAMLLAGFGLSGLMLRRRRLRVVSA